MSEIFLRGTLDGLTEAVNRIKAVIDRRRVEGWIPGHPSEQWLYLTFPGRAKSGKVCPLCQAHGRKGIFSGDELAATFPRPEYVGGGILLPHTHEPDLSAFFYEPCHCEMHLQNAAESAELRLHEEKLEVV